ncbi:MAG: DUF4465 domain-containing protein [Kiritimatiellia bacterium]|nr:DUF4465 domain-containing protein [Kiritimatiellia bacterium]
MNRTMIAAGAALVLLTGRMVDGAVVDFDDLSLPGENGYWNGSDESGGFFSGGVFFTNDYNAAWSSWQGFSYSNVNDPGTPGYENQYAVYQPGKDRSGMGNYAVGYYTQPSFWSPEFRPRLTLASPAEVLDLYVNNTAYVALSVRDGDGFVSPFEEGDWLRLRIAGLDDLLNPVGSEVEVYLADYRDGKTFIMDSWTQVNLGDAFGSAVKHIEFRIDGTKTGDFGLDTPAYFAIDDLQVIPEPGVWLLSLIGAAFVSIRKRRAG